MIALLTLIVTAIVAGLALLAQYGRKSRGAEITLLVTVFALSLLVGGLGALTGIGLFLQAGLQTSGGASLPNQAAFLAAGVTAILVGIVGVGLCVPPLLKIVGRAPLGARIGFLADPPVFLALWLLLVVLANNAVSFLIFTQEPDVSTLFPSGRVSPTEILTSQLPFVIVALAGIGLGLRRNLRETIRRLGYGPISLRQLAVVVVFVAVAFGLSAAADALFSALQPDLYQTVGDLSQSLFDPKGLSPVSAVLFSLLIGLGAALGEETLFRGAVQPKFGIVVTSILFASMHIQYGPSVLLGYIFLLSIGLGLLRRRFNTTTSFIAHAGYNAIGVLLTYFFGF